MNEQFAFDLFPLIQIKRFTLRAADVKDRQDLLALYSDESVVQYMPFTPFESVEDAEGEMSWYAKIFKERTGLRWMIEDRITNQVIGTCGFLNYEDVHNRVVYRERHLVECFFNKVKNYRCLATRYDKLACTFKAFLTLASIMVCLLKFEDTP